MLSLVEGPMGFPPSRSCLCICIYFGRLSPFSPLACHRSTVFHHHPPFDSDPNGPDGPMILPAISLKGGSLSFNRWFPFLSSVARAAVARQRQRRFVSAVACRLTESPIRPSVRHDPKDGDPAYAIAEVRQDGSETMILHPTDDLKQMFGAE